MKDKIAVTGGNGFIGRYLINQLSSEGYQVIAIDQAPFIADLPNVESLQIDISTGYTQLKEAFAGCRYVYHFAAISDIEDCNSKPSLAIRVNILGTAQVLEAAHAAGVERVIYASSAYASSRRGGVYRTTKRAAEGLLVDFQDYYGLNYTAVRVGTVYGPGCDRRNSVYRFVHEAMTTNQISYHGDGGESREYIHIVDIARMLVQMLEKHYENRTVVFTGTHPTRVADMFALISDILGTPIAVNYKSKDGRATSHYRISPFSFVKDVVMSVSTNESVDLGQGVVGVAKAIHEELSGQPVDSEAEQ